ncbi:ATPase [candidate division LCP-89 bacterium B3_LCP]|uniref:ATPase n=1 Tax=candidate division LCP-89 bacterium B3_LCP TaxID=2012998 RepID=A0A532V2W3_UNCL8|nr:MAG: ATPase [candidate division LCP-89 bacterium B3_LCP]
MLVNKIKFNNFRSFKDIDVDLGNFNVLIGANASGKSNFIQAFKFLRDIKDFGLENAISMQGGIKYLRNIRIGNTGDLSVEIQFDGVFSHINKDSNGGYTAVKFTDSAYTFTMRFHKKGEGFTIVKDKLEQNCEWYEIEKPFKTVYEISKGKTLWNGKFINEVFGPRRNRRVFSTFDPRTEDIESKLDMMLPRSVETYEFKERELMWEHRFSYNIIPPLALFIEYTAIYDFDPKLPKKAVPITGKAELEEDGSNLALVLKNIIKDKEQKRRFLNLIQDLLPFIDDLGISKFADKSHIFKLREKYFKDQYLPASLISDGTINLTALIIALYFEKKDFIIIEEPERNVHPALISNMIEMMKDASEKKQIIVTTHNPEVVRHAGLENLLFVSRDSDGFSEIKRLHEREEIKTFLKHEIGVEDLYILDLLEG